MFKACAGYTAKRDFAILSVLFSTGVRVEELQNLQLGDIYEDTIIVTGKGQKKREIYLPPQTKKAIDDYLKIRLPTDVNYLFTSPEGR
ncbi:MAG: tyrosine-type recombinase/integrase, partial [Thermoplasmata archaeon]